MSNAFTLLPSIHCKLLAFDHHGSTADQATGWSTDSCRTKHCSQPICSSASGHLGKPEQQQDALKSTIEQLDASTGGKRAIKEDEGAATRAISSHQAGNTNVTVVAPNSMEETIEAAQIGGTKRRSSDDDDPEMKRQKFLERNRAAAAMRCREKKQWVVNLESKAENLTVTNVKLNNEVLKLKNEVAQLKQLLLAHKDCPVTQMQQRNHRIGKFFTVSKNRSLHGRTGPKLSLKYQEC
ncbi:Cyclic AMP-responsive element-binding protein 5 [Apostichopus japonicus]|uniref:Cyclic AMP-responsive element-binding protein 5 n=1 Tax=Stichopus japonicus TaxID=307972 RepID=A0A2G8JUS8_STIJA|nr:Cyclic AMP-responsive element-binding protein 5 [Apostichopus japonicus]